MVRLFEVAGAILAGGRATRMNHQDKGLLLLSGKPLWMHLYRQLMPQVLEVVISANRHLDIYQRSGLSVIPDTLPDYPGPLAGMLAVMEQLPQEWFLFCACDTPLLPRDLAARLWHRHSEAPVIWVYDGKRDHPTLALINRRILPALRRYLTDGKRRIISFFRQQGGLPVEINEQIVNLNTLNDWLHWSGKAT